MSQIRSKTERAFAAHAESKVLDPSPFRDSTLGIEVGFHVRSGEIGEDGELPEEWEKLSLPAVIFSCPRAPEHESGAGFRVAELTIVNLASIDEPESPERVEARMEWLTDLLAVPEDIYLALNKPASGADGRPVKNYRVIGLFLTDDSSQMIGRRAVDTLTYSVFCVEKD